MEALAADVFACVVCVHVCVCDWQKMERVNGRGFAGCASQRSG